MDNKDKFLPIGTVVRLKGGKREIMITSYCIVPNGDIYDKTGKIENPKQQMFDYGACFYPEGMLVTDQTFAFNHDQIEQISFMGYETDKQHELSNTLITGAEKIKEELENLNMQQESQI